MSTTVTTQAEMDAALAAGAETIIIRSPRGVRLTISCRGNAMRWLSSISGCLVLTVWRWCNVCESADKRCRCCS